MANDSIRKNKQAAAKVNLRAGPNWLLFGLALLGMALSGYLTFSAWQGSRVAFCTQGAGCDVVLNSRWSTLFGMPLTSVAFFELQAACPYCLTSLALMSTIFIVITFQRPKSLAKFSWGPWLAKTVGVAVVAILALHLHYAGYWGDTQGPEDPWVRALAEHLSKSDAKFYGASWCPHCAQQKDLFGASVKRIPYVECSPGGPQAPSAPVCKEKNISSYPTWIINGQRYTGVQPLDALAQLTNFKYQGGKP